jgi:hypothetical protein
MDDSRDDVDPDAAFGAVSDPTRVAVVRTLAEHRKHHPDDPALGFAALRKRVDVRDSGRFLYHLKKLLGIFVEKTDDGAYRLTYAGEQVALAILAGVFTGRTRRGPTELDSECPLCGTTAVGTFDDGALSVTCGEDHRLLVWRFSPNAGEAATVPELTALATMQIRHEVESALTGFCGACYGTTTTAAAERGEGSPVSVRFHAECEDCGSRLDGPLWYALFAHPETTAFYRDHGWSVRGTYLWEFEAEVRETPFPGDGDPTPDTYHVVVALDDEELHAALDADGHVVRTATVQGDDPSG